MKIAAPPNLEALAASSTDDRTPAGPHFERIVSEEGEDGRLESFEFHSGILPDPAFRRVSVYLPPQYAADPGCRFPVFYLHDGQNLFDPRTSYIPGRTWRAGSTADDVNLSGLARPLILVGIANTGLRRMAEYTPTRDFKMGGGEGDRYGRLLVEELIPFIDRTYRTGAGPENTGLGGSSLGGLISLYLGLEYPQVFGRLGVLSPSVWWDQRSILSYVRDFDSAAGARPRIWLDIGTAEGQRHVRDTELLNRLLEKQGWRSGRTLAFDKVEGAFHSEDAWADRFDRVLRFLFPVER